MCTKVFLTFTDVREIIQGFSPSIVCAVNLTEKKNTLSAIARKNPAE